MASNIPPSIRSKIGKNLHCQPHHPLEIVKRKITEYLNQHRPFTLIDNLPPTVDVTDNFDALLIPPTHSSRSRSDTFYESDGRVLRTHTSAHQSTYLTAGESAFLIAGDVYRKDEIDRTHFPVFHQLEGVCLLSPDLSQEEVLADLKKVLSSLVEYLFPGREYRYNDDYFPFVVNGLEIEVRFNDRWLEILGAGVIHPTILQHTHRSEVGWAFGLGLERIAMAIFEIPDIRYFWVEHDRFLRQFYLEETVDFRSIKFVPYSTLPAIHQDVSGWLSDDYQENDFYTLVREHGGRMVESVTLIDEFTHPRTHRQSKTYRILYSSHDPEMTNPAEFLIEVKQWHQEICSHLQQVMTIR